MKLNLKSSISSLIASSSLFLVIPSAHGVSLRITFENFDLGNGSVFAPLSAVFHDGDTDNFDLGQSVDVPAYDGMQELAELGDSQERNDSLLSNTAISTIVGSGPIGPGVTVSTIIDVDAINGGLTYVNYASMFVPSNDAFIGNDDPLAFQVFDAQGNFIAQDIDVLASTIWDAGTEMNDEAIGNAAIPGISDASGHVPQNGVVTFHPGFIPGGTIESNGFLFPNPDDIVANIKIEAVTTTSTPEPSTFLGLLAVCSIGLVSKLKKKVK